MSFINDALTPPQLVEAISIGFKAFSAISKIGEIGQVESIFRVAFHFLTPNRQVIFVGGSAISNSPISIVTNIPAKEYMTSLGLRVGVKVMRSKNSLDVGGTLSISLDDAEIWRPKKSPVGKIVDIADVKNNLLIATKLAYRKGRHGGLGSLLRYTDKIVSGEEAVLSDCNLFVQTAAPSICSLIKAIRENNPKSLKKSAESLAGLGPGLSPSADDMLSGLMEAMYFTVKSLGGNIGFVDRVNRTIVAAITGKTSLMSQQLLAHASRGDVAEVTENVMEAILATSATETESTVSKILCLGSNSGTDIMLGLILGIRLSIDSLILQK